MVLQKAGWMDCVLVERMVVMTAERMDYLLGVPMVGLMVDCLVGK